MSEVHKTRGKIHVGDICLNSNTWELRQKNHEFLARRIKPNRKRIKQWLGCSLEAEQLLNMALISYIRQRHYATWLMNNFRTDLSTQGPAWCVYASVGWKWRVSADYHLIVSLSFGSLPPTVLKGEQWHTETCTTMENYQSEIRGG